MARFFWDDKTHDEELVKLSDDAEIQLSLEFMMSDPIEDPELFSAQTNLIKTLSDEHLIYKIKGNISKLLNLEFGYNTAVAPGPLLRGLEALVRQAEQRYSKSPWDHEVLKSISENRNKFFANLKNHTATPSDVQQSIGNVDFETVTFRDILKEIFLIDSLILSVDIATSDEQEMPQSFARNQEKLEEKDLELLVN